MKGPILIKRIINERADLIKGPISLKGRFHERADLILLAVSASILC